MNLLDIRPFIPCQDFEISQAFYRALGFSISPAGDELALGELGNCTIFLQKYYNKELAENLMMQLIVDDAERFYHHLSHITDMDMKYSDVKHEHWGKVVYLWGPAGELWHVTELHSQ